MKKDTQSKCYHCGGVLTASEDMLTCLMCGRPLGHKCELCINLPRRRDVSAGQPKSAKKGRRKKSTVTR